MNSVIKRKSAFATLALSLLLWGCDNVSTPVEPRLAPAPMVVMSTSGETFTVVLESDPSAGSVSADIGPGGGSLTLGKHTLTVNPDAVSEVTTFTLTRDLENPLRVKLTAGRNGEENNIGSAGFGDDKVFLAISYENAGSLPADEGVLEMLYFRPDGLVEDLSSEVRWGDDQVVAELSHFSLYGIGWP